MLYYNYNDCRPEGAQTLPADEWRWQIGGLWVATVGETDESWWGNDTPESIGAPKPHVYPITEVPTTGTLVYWDADGNEGAPEGIAVAAADYAVELYENLRKPDYDFTSSWDSDSLAEVATWAARKALGLPMFEGEVSE